MIVFLVVTSATVLKCFFGDRCVPVNPEQVTLLLTFGSFELVAEAFGVKIWGARINRKDD